MGTTLPSSIASCASRGGELPSAPSMAAPQRMLPECQQLYGWLLGILLGLKCVRSPGRRNQKNRLQWATFTDSTRATMEPQDHLRNPAGIVPAPELRRAPNADPPASC